MSFKYEYKETEIGTIPKEWDIKSLGNSLYIKGRIGWKGLKKNEYLQDGDFRIINGANIVDNKIDWERCGFIPEERYNESPEIMLQKDDIVMTKDGTIGKVAIVKILDVKTTVASGLFVIRALSEDIDVDYLYYYFNSNYFKGLVDTRVEGSVIPHLYQRDLVELKIPFPKIDEQKKISTLLRTLDNKIDLNNELNKTLEEIAQALFKRWFIDFEFPNEDGTAYKSSGGDMVESELGMIPKGWSVKNLNDISLITMGVSPSSSSYNEENIGLPLLNGASDFQGKLIRPSKYTSEPKKICNEGEMVFGVRATIGNTVFADGEYALGRGVAAVKPNYDFYREFIYFTLNNSMDRLISSASGSVFLNLKKADITDLKLCLNEEIVTKFHKVTNNLINKVIENDKESEMLKQQRDSLLPKLMSGEIRVEDLEANL